jgi:sarcosine oxidase subunit alpha
MLRESGVIFDDGTVVKLASDRYLLTTTSGNAERVSLWLQEWQQCEWPDLRVAILPVTDQWACLSLTGPRARDILSGLETSIDLSPSAFPHLSLREGLLLGHAARIYRVSFTGELTYEINVPRTAGPEIWEALIQAGEPHGLAPIGVDSLLRLRLEKGFLHVGTDTDGTTVPEDVGWGNVARNKRADFIGKRSLSLPEHLRPDRLQLIGLRSDADIPIGSHLRLANSREVTDGWVTSAARTVLTHEPIALALVRGGRQHVGTEVSVHDAGKVTSAGIVTPPFHDVSGARMHA